MPSKTIIVLDDTVQPPLLVYEGTSAKDATVVAQRYATQTGRVVRCGEFLELAEVEAKPHPQGREPNPSNPLPARVDDK